MSDDPMFSAALNYALERIEKAHYIDAMTYSCGYRRPVSEKRCYDFFLSCLNTLARSGSHSFWEAALSPSWPRVTARPETIIPE